MAKIKEVLESISNFEDKVQVVQVKFKRLTADWLKMAEQLTCL